MPEPSRIETLKVKHADLDHQIFEEQKRPSPDFALVHELKRRKLLIKDELTREPVH